MLQITSDFCPKEGARAAVLAAVPVGKKNFAHYEKHAGPWGQSSE